MKGALISNCERQFVLQTISNGQRLDGRGLDAFRNLELHFGSDYGSCYAVLGETKVFANVSYTLNEPRPLRPTEGLLFINVDISETVCSSYETGNSSHLATHINRLLEKCLKESKCLDMEALCISSGEQVFDIRVDVSVLNCDGNLLTCCSVATLAALGHFRLPVFSMEDSGLIIYSVKEKAPTPLSLHHFPILISFAVFCDGEVVVVDPTELEEKVSEGELVVGMNNYREMCGLHFSGRAIANKDLLVSSANRAGLIATECVKRLKAALEEDQKCRDLNRGESKGFTTCIHKDRILSSSRDRQSLRLLPEQVQDVIDRAKNKMKLEENENEGDEDQNDNSENETGDAKSFTSPDRQGGVIISAMKAKGFGKEWEPTGGKSCWEMPDLPPEENDDEDESDSDNDVNFVKEITDEDRIIDKIELSGDSEEEEVIVLK